MANNNLNFAFPNEFYNQTQIISNNIQEFIFLSDLEDFCPKSQKSSAISFKEGILEDLPQSAKSPTISFKGGILEDNSYDNETNYIESNQIEIFNLTDLFKNEKDIPLEFGLEISSEDQVLRLNIEDVSIDDLEKQINELDLYISQYVDLDKDYRKLLEDMDENLNIENKLESSLLDKVREIGLKNIIASSVLIAGGTILIPAGTSIYLGVKIAIGTGILGGYMYLKRKIK